MTIIKREPSDLELHYRDTVLHIQKLILRRATWPFTKIVGLTPTEIGQIAALLAEAHTVAAEAREAA